MPLQKWQGLQIRRKSHNITNPRTFLSFIILLLLPIVHSQAVVVFVVLEALQICQKPAMVCTAKDLLEWNNFPKGLRVLLVDHDVNYASEIRSKLEKMDYIVSMFCNEDEALSAALSRPDAFHVAIIEVSTIDCDESFKFLRMAKGLPTIMIASVQCLNTSMKCIALGAVEVLNKPLSDDKLRNIWQHVVHKAYTAVENRATESPRLDVLMEELPCLSDDNCDNEELDRSSGNDKCPAPSTPQLKQVWLSDDPSCQNRSNWTSEKDSAEQYEESKSVETTCFNATAGNPSEINDQMQDCAVKEENDDAADGCKSESDTSPAHQNQPEIESSSLPENTKIKNTQSECRGTKSDKICRKKMKVDWTSELHKKFVQAVEQLGIEQAIPSRILELMKVEGLTRHNVASHLQKYRMHRRHTLPKREERKLSVRPKDATQSSYYYQHKPIMAYPPMHQPYHSAQTLGANQPLYPTMWIHPGSHAASMPAWGPQYQTWPWKSYTAMQAEAWGCPVMPASQSSYSYYPQNVSAFYGGAENTPHCIPSNIRNDHHLAEEVIDRTVKEAISKPWLPLPLGLKPPSTESVLSELSKQGISNIPPSQC